MAQLNYPKPLYHEEGILHSSLQGDSSFLCFLWSDISDIEDVAESQDG